jgi:hypothetical protein
LPRKQEGFFGDQQPVFTKIADLPDFCIAERGDRFETEVAQAEAHQVRALDEIQVAAVFSLCRGLAGRQKRRHDDDQH